MVTHTSAPDAGELSFDSVKTFSSRVADALSPHKLRKASEDHFVAKFWETSIGRIQLVQFASRGVLEAEIPKHLDYFDFVLPLAGRAEVRVNGNDHALQAGGGGVLFPPAARIEMRLGDEFDQLHLRVTPDVLLTHAENLLGCALPLTVSFETTEIVKTGEQSDWTQLFTAIATDGNYGQGKEPHPLLRSQFEEVLLTGLMLSIPNSASAFMDANVLAPTPKTLRRAIDFIRANVSEPLTVGMIAQSLNISSRSLQRGFRELLNTTPMRYLADLRLARVRAELLSGEGPAVNDVAYRWGFTHLSRFAQKYANRYGEKPMETLRQSR